MDHGKLAASCTSSLVVDCRSNWSHSDLQNSLVTSQPSYDAYLSQLSPLDSEKRMVGVLRVAGEEMGPEEAK